MPLRKFVDKAARSAAHKAANAGSKAAEAISIGAGAVAEAGSKAASNISSAAQKMQYDKLQARYNPVFPEEYEAPDYDLPNLIVIEDEDKRKNIDFCKGAIGWLQTQDGMEILHLYEEAVPFSGLNFYPQAICEAAYYIDTFNRDRFIQLDLYHEIIQKEKFDELSNIAHSLGAKECYLEAFEEERTFSRAKATSRVKGGVLGKSASAATDIEQNTESSKKRSVIFTQTFEGSDEPREPKLNWFKQDKGILSLIDKRCSGNNTIKEHSVQIDTSSSSALSASRAARIDSALKVAKVSTNVSMEKELRRESQKRLVYHIKF